MINSFPYILAFLITGVALIVILTTHFKVPAFFALLLTCLFVGLGIQLPLGEVISTIKDGFGNILKSLGLIIVLGTTLGLLLEYTGSTTVMAAFILNKLGSRRAPLAMSITGFIVGLPIFCDSGYIVLSGLNKSIAKRTLIPMSVMSVSLATGLYAVHCLVPPHPGSAGAAGIIGVDFGKLILVGIVVAIPAMFVGNYWARYAGRTVADTAVEDVIEKNRIENYPSLVKAFLPVVVPIVLIGIKSFFTSSTTMSHEWLSFLLSLGDPVMALSIGVLLAFNCNRSWKKAETTKILQDATEKAGGILMIIGMGGGFGAILAVSKVGEHFSQSMALGSMGIFFPFLLTSVLKTAQGSSTVAIITAASIVLPLLPALGLSSETGRLFCVLAMGAGSMMISHANDAYFWVIAKFSGLEMKTMLKVYSVATLLMGLTTITMVYILSKLF
ncbi:MAG TPA: GntP family permease [Mucilaginibacter sp.]|jgi:GntP family gluconate:H+ symporter